MASRIAVLLIALTAGCAGESRQHESSKLVVLNDAYVEDRAVGLNGEYPDTKPGVWLDINGSRFCDGYLTSNESVDFCSATAPKDWKSFTYDGREYYYQALSGQ